MSKISFEDIGAVVATFAAEEGVCGGQVVKVTGSGTVGPCGDGDAFCGMAFQPRKGMAAVQVKGFLTVSTTGTSGMGMFNGDIGVIRSIEGDAITVDFDGKVVEYAPDMLGELEPAFAVTVHKAQGSEYRAVILAALDGAPMLMTRGVLYTAITRAKELFIVVGDHQAVAHMVANDRQTRRYSGLRARLAEEGKNSC